VTVDPTGRLAGRGAYVCIDAACLDRAVAKGALARALRTPIPADLRTALAGSITANTADIEGGGSRGQE
jgi:hypothetical protein